MPALDLGTLLGIPAFPKYLGQINTALEASLADADPLIRTAALRHVLAPSKRLRPSMVLAVVHGMGKPVDKDVIAACVSIELAHISSLIHDDIIDNAGSRRGIPTINSQEGIDQAIIIGDYILAEACAQAATISAEASRVVARAIARICDGQSREVADQYNTGRDSESMLASIRGKTAELFAAACKIGGLCAGLTAPQLDAISAYGENFGMAFQLIDDALDFVSSDKLLGKPVGNDIVEGVYTMPLLLALHGPRQEEVRETLAARARPAAAFIELLIDQNAIGKTLEAAKDFNKRAVAELEKLGGKTSDTLLQLPDIYLAWSLQNLVAAVYRSRLNI